MRFPAAELEALPFLWEELSKETRPVVLYGMGNGADAILRACDVFGVHVSGVFASDDFVRGHSYAGFPVRSYSETMQLFPECRILLAFGTHRTEVIERIVSIAEQRSLHLPALEVVSGSPYTRDRFGRDCSLLAEVYDTIDDEKSRRVFLNILRFRITGNIEFLVRTWTPEAEGLPMNRELVLDGGAYTGDTARRFLENGLSCSGLIAVEPDPRSFRKLVRNLRGFKRAKAVQAALGDRCRTISFGAAGGRQSRVEAAGVLVHQTTLDSFQAEPPTFIKLDLEGRETAALQGGRRLIRSTKPKLQISAYHRYADLYAIPRLLRAIRPDYSIRLRTTRCLPAWDMYWECL